MRAPGPIRDDPSRSCRPQSPFETTPLAVRAPGPIRDAGHRELPNEGDTIGLTIELALKVITDLDTKKRTNIIASGRSPQQKASPEHARRLLERKSDSK